MREIISICVPTYNGAAYLAETLDSILAQTFSNLDVLVVDDQSTDDTVEIAHSYAVRDARIRIFQNHHNLGLVGNWNRCVELAKGEWIKFVFQDDLLTPDCIEKMINALNKSPGKEKAIFCKKDHLIESINHPRDLKLLMNKINFFWDIFPDKVDIKPSDVIKVILNWPARNIFGEPSLFLIHREIFDRIGGFDDSFHHICDLEYWLRIGVNFPILMVPDTLVRIRIHENSASNFNRREKWLQMRHLDKIKLFRKFMYNDLYRSLREEINTWPCNIYLKTLTAIYIRIAEKAVRAEKSIQWNNDFAVFCKEYSDVADLRKTNFFILAFRYVLSYLCLKTKWTIGSLISKIPFLNN
jgi:glycosyltransferase involved in cell wall biosynthesis